MSPLFPSRRAPVLAGVALGVLVLGAGLFACDAIDRARLEILETRLTTAAEVLRVPAEAALDGRGSRVELAARMRDLAAATGLRLTLIDADGRVLSDSEVREAMPNLADRPEVVAAQGSGTASAYRLSVVTGKETLYVARSLVRDGRRLGTIRTATERSEIDATLAGLERLVLILAAANAVCGAVVGGIAVARSRRDRVAVAADSPDAPRAIERAAA